MDSAQKQTLAPPAVTALKLEATSAPRARQPMERSVSQSIRDEMEDLKEAAEQALNVLLDLNMDSTIRSVSPSWREVVGTDPDSVVGKPIADYLVGNKRAFADAVDNMKQDDARSRLIRFCMHMGPASRLKPKREAQSAEEPAEERPEESDQILNLEAQGIMSYNPTSGNDCHTMWMIKPSVVREVTIDLPGILVESLGVGAEVLACYLTELAEAGADDPATHPPPPAVLCRICERHINPWWFEKHTDLCLQEHRAEMEVQMAQENLSDHRNAIVKVLDALEASSQRTSRPLSADMNSPAPPTPEYKGLPISPASTPSSGLSSGRASPASPPSRSRDRSSGVGHRRARSFAIRRPVSRIVELVLDLCDTALEINTPAIKDNRGQLTTELRTQSPQSENRISQVMQWQSPSIGINEGEQGLFQLCEDTAKYSKAKVDAIFRYRRILEYSERIRGEFEILVQECIEAAISKAQSIARGELSDSGESTASQTDDNTFEGETPDAQPEEGLFPCSLENPSSLTAAMRNSSDSSHLHMGRRPSSAATSTRSSSPRGSQTPRSHGGAISIVSHSKRASMHFESDTGADSDSSMRSSVMSGPRRAESPSSEMGLKRVTSSRERKRRSLILPSVMQNSRQQSPARQHPQPPSSPLRMSKGQGRGPGGSDAIHSPITSPILSTSEFSSPALTAQHVHHHRRQSSTAGSDVLRPPVSPRLIPSSNPQPRAVPPSIKDFEIIKPISKGAFGSVYLSKKKSTGDYFAIKVLKKADMIAKNQVTNVKAERAIMMWQGESDFVAKLYWTFSSKDYLYLVMEYLNGGDCASLIKVLGALPEDWAKKYLAEVVLGVEHLHSRGIVHRDLKPDNLLIDQKGHLKLTDFGLSRMGLIGRQKRALNSKADEVAPDLLKQGPFHRALSVTSSRSASFDAQGSHSPQNTPALTPALSGDLGQPSYFSLSLTQEPRRASGQRSDSGDSEALNALFRRFSIVDDHPTNQRRIEEEVYMSEDGGGGSPDPYTLQPTISHQSAVLNTPPPSSTMMPPPMALFDPEDSNRRFVGTPDYLAPETINGSGQDEVSDWWSLGCILFECLYGYPPFHAETPDEVFQNILERKIDWPPEDEYEVSDEAKDLMNRLMSTDPRKRLGANIEDNFVSGGEEIRKHPWFADMNWDSLRDDEASFVPASENPEDTEYFDARGATMQNFAAEFEDQNVSSTGTPGADYPDRPHDALSRVRSQVQVNSVKRSLMPLHIPPHVREGRTRRLSEPMATDDFGAFAFKNLPVLEKANKDVIQKLRAEAMQAQSKPPSTVTSPSVTSPSPSLDSSPMGHVPLKRTQSSASKGNGRPSSPSVSQVSSSPSRASQPSSPLLVSFSTGQNHERRKTSSGASSLSHQPPTAGGSSLQPGSFFDAPRMANNAKLPGTSPMKQPKTPGATVPPEKASAAAHQRQNSFPRTRSQTIGSQDEEPTSAASHHKRRSQVFTVSPSSSDNEDSKQKEALLRVHRRRQSTRRMSHVAIDGPVFRPLDCLICEDHPVSRLVMEKLLEKLRCRTICVRTGPEAIRYAMSEVKFDIIMMEYRLPQVNGADVARMIRETKNPNSNTPIVAVTGYLKELSAPHHFDALIEKPPTIAKLTEVLGRLCQWRPPPPNWTPAQLPPLVPSNLRQESSRLEDSPTSNSSGFAQLPPGSYRGSSREDSISSSFFGENDGRGDDVPVVISKQGTEEWKERDLAREIGGLGIAEEQAAALEDQKKLLHPMPAPLPLRHETSAPAAMEHPAPRKQRSSEQITAKRHSLEKMKHESAESGDDEDEELGNSPSRDRSPGARSPKGRARGSSKLGVEMMRTNSHGSVISVEEMVIADALVSTPPAAIEENPLGEHSETARTPANKEAETVQDKITSLTPPEILPQRPGDTVKEIDVDTEATPKASHSDVHDPDPTPRASTSPSRKGHTSSP
ncbi:uncharacterized protein K452DRAFT_218378 [Aplosporella prunicola CBS 121167]|uniref:non-specific serine/threonine protein kinase n=1 Tax=Aplosporella prunicola CBS 121167 TaxID=1176127 RepID=A0A6A6BR68_9PEZI|nr:uncharacterized protein K452DRAFT_218378 [Aplosporella prunicola CBS 121167]KAF2146586.1 hypothetical protein K452DRAFT_218378 [Aplosporella prunicola CBS 121167]